MASPISLRINGEEHVDFKSAQVSYSLEGFARTFAFDFSDKWLQTRIRALPFAEGDPCEVYVHGEKVVDGYIDDLPVSYDATSHSIQVTGRSWAGHMVDSSAIHKGGSWRNVKIADLAKDLCKPFGVDVVIDAWALPDTLEPFDRWAIEDEETAYACLQRAAELRGLFLTSDGERNVVITKASPVVHPDALVFGQNIKRARRMGRFADRHSFYLVKAQSAGSDTWYAENAAGPFCRVEDAQVTAYRPLIIVADGSGKKQELQARATWERNVRAGRSRRISYTLVGHRSKADRVWPANERVAVSDPYLDCKDPLLIAAVMLSYSEAGEIAELELCRPEAFDVLAPPPKKGKKKKGFMDGL